MSISTGERGFTYVGLLLAVALAGVGLATAGTLWTAAAVSEREAQLLFVGDQYRRALESYAAQTPAGGHRFPASLDELLDDRRWPRTHRHLRRHYADPFTGDRDWVLIREPQGRIIGLHSRATTQSKKRAGFPPQYESFASATRYSEWTFKVAELSPTRPSDRDAAAPTIAPATKPEADSGRGGAAQILSDARSRTPEACVRIQQDDLATCDEVARVVDAKAAQVCRASASRRFAACGDRDAANLPPLFFPRLREAELEEARKGAAAASRVEN